MESDGGLTSVAADGMEGRLLGIMINRDHGCYMKLKFLRT